MRTVSTVVISFVLGCGVDSEVAESPPASQLLDRIVALENRDYEQLKRISSLEERVKLSEERVQQLTMANEEMIKHNTDQLKEKDALTTKFQLEIKALIEAVEAKERLIFNLQLKVNEFDSKLDEQAEQKKEIRRIHTEQTTRKNSLDGNLASQSSDEIHLKKVLPHKNGDKNNNDEPQERYDNGLYRAVENTKKVSTEQLPSDDGKILLKLRAMQHFVPEINNDQNKERRQSSFGTVAFHAGLQDGVLVHQNAGNTIVFPDVTLNIGNGYHNHHGLFTAPRAGVYLFSATLMSDSKDFQEVHESIVKNGQRLSRIHLLGQNGNSDQSSISVVTLLNVGDEVWVQFDHPSNSAVWGNGFTDFTGVLVAAT